MTSGSNPGSAARKEIALQGELSANFRQKPGVRMLLCLNWGDSLW